VRRHIRALGHVAQVAQVAVLYHLPVDAFVHAIELERRRGVDGIEQDRERLAQAEAAPATMADVEHPLQLGIERRLIVERRVTPVERVAGRSLKATLASAAAARN